MLHDKLIQKNDRLLVEGENPDAASGQYPLEDTNIQLLLHSVSYLTGASVSLIPAPMPNVPDIDPNAEEFRLDFADEKDAVTTDERITATGLIDNDRIYVADREEGEKARHEEVEIIFRRIPPQSSEKDKELSDEEYKFEVARKGSCLIHWCGALLEGDDHREDYLLVEAYVVDEVFDLLKAAITSTTERIEKIQVGLRVRVFWSEMDQSLREWWMSRDLVILRDKRIPAAVTSLQIQRQQILHRVVEHDEELGEIETDRFEDHRDAPKRELAPIISPKDLKHIKTSLRLLAIAAIAVAIGVLAR